MSVCVCVFVYENCVWFHHPTSCVLLPPPPHLVCFSAPNCTSYGLWRLLYVPLSSACTKCLLLCPPPWSLIIFQYFFTTSFTLLILNININFSLFDLNKGCVVKVELLENSGASIETRESLSEINDKAPFKINFDICKDYTKSYFVKFSIKIAAN